MRQLSPGFLELSDEPSVVLDPVDRRDAEDGAADAALVVVVVGLAAETEVEAPERGSLEYKHTLFLFSRPCAGSEFAQTFFLYNIKKRQITQIYRVWFPPITLDPRETKSALNLGAQ